MIFFLIAIGTILLAGISGLICYAIGNQHGWDDGFKTGSGSDWRA